MLLFLPSSLIARERARNKYNEEKVKMIAHKKAREQRYGYRKGTEE